MTKMQPITRVTLQQIDEAAWFSRVGTKDTKVAMVLSSWPEAIESCSYVEWEDLRLDAANQLCARIMERSRERFAKWNETALEVKNAVGPLVMRKIDEVTRERNFPKVFHNSVRWDIMHLCMEAEYADLCHPAFFAGISYFYVNGHFPCGWSGEYPKGMLVIY
jgi:hypothetical protein